MLARAFVRMVPVFFSVIGLIIMFTSPWSLRSLGSSGSEKVLLVFSLVDHVDDQELVLPTCLDIVAPVLVILKKFIHALVGLVEVA